MLMLSHLKSFLSSFDPNPLLDPSFKSYLQFLPGPRVVFVLTRIFCWKTLPVWSVESAILSTPIKILVQGKCQVDWRSRIRIQPTFHFLWDENSSFFIVRFNIVHNTVKITKPWNINWWPGVSWLWHWMEKGVSCSQHRVIYTHTHTYKNETICYSLGSN